MCIHCGYPLKKIQIYNINGVKYDFSNIISDINNELHTPASYIRQISDMCNIPIFEAKEIYFKIKNNETIPQNIICKNKEQEQNTPKCPYCHSTNVQKISVTSKAVNTALFGIFGTKRHKNYHCNNCKSDF